jgi:hypothetical protein
MAIISFFLTFLLTISAVTVYAYTESTWWNYGPISGYYYSSAARCYSNEPSGAMATTCVQPQYGGTAPSGYMGCYARLYNGAGYLKIIPLGILILVYLMVSKVAHRHIMFMTIITATVSLQLIMVVNMLIITHIKVQ